MWGRKKWEILRAGFLQERRIQSRQGQKHLTDSVWANFCWMEKPRIMDGWVDRTGHFIRRREKKKRIN